HLLSALPEQSASWVLSIRPDETLSIPRDCARQTGCWPTNGGCLQLVNPRGQDSLCPTRRCILGRNSTTTHELPGTRIHIKRAVVGNGHGMCDAGRDVRIRAHRSVTCWTHRL